MTFGQTYRALTVKEWRRDFFDYDRLRSIVFSLRTRTRTSSYFSKLFKRSSSAERSSHKRRDGLEEYRERDDAFVQALQTELDKVQTFHTKRKEELRERHAVLMEQQQIMNQMVGKSATVGEVQMLKNALEEHYKTLKLLEHFRALNITAIVRVIHKYESTVKINTDYASRVTDRTFCTNESVKEMIASIEKILEEEPYNVTAKHLVIHV
jgi:SPX domain protein involved in polyphosphate accumulation